MTLGGGKSLGDSWKDTLCKLEADKDKLAYVKAAPNQFESVQVARSPVTLTYIILKVDTVFGELPMRQVLPVAAVLLMSSLYYTVWSSMHIYIYVICIV